MEMTGSMAGRKGLTDLCLEMQACDVVAGTQILGCWAIGAIDKPASGLDPVRS